MQTLRPDHVKITVNIGEDEGGRPIWLEGVLIGPETIPGMGAFQRVVVTDQRDALVEMSVHRSAIRLQ